MKSERQIVREEKTVKTGENSEKREKTVNSNRQAMKTGEKR